MPDPVVAPAHAAVAGMSEAPTPETPTREAPADEIGSPAPRSSEAPVDEAVWRMAIAALLAAAPAGGDAPPAEAGALDATAWAESIRALAGTGTGPVPIAAPRAPAGLAPAATARDPLAALRDAVSRNAA
ncbi:hypothetical protein [Methylobacterium aquaticum]|nr:hypothetical protein [Methylobacterium aquaticum]